MKNSVRLLLICALFILTGFRNPPGALRYVEIGDKFLANGENELALSYYSRAIGMEPNRSGLYTSRGFLLLKLNRIDEALGDFSTFIRLEPQNPQGYLCRGMVYSQLQRDKEAEADYSRACKLGDQSGCSFMKEER